MQTESGASTEGRPGEAPTSANSRQNARLPPTGRPSPKLAQMLAGLTPEQVEIAITVAAKLLARKAKKKAEATRTPP